MTYMYPDLSDGALFEPSGFREIGIILELLKIQPGQKAVDLGSGDGRIVIAIAQEKVNSYGFEKNPLLVQESQKNIEIAGLSHLAHIYNIDFWQQNLSSFDKIVIFQYYTIMARLEKKLSEELRPGTFVVSHHWTFPNWKPVKQIEDIFLYVKNL